MFASSRSLPDLAPGLIGGLSFAVVCVLLGAALGVSGMRIYAIVELLEGSSQTLRHVELATGLETLLLEAGLLVGASATVYLLAWIAGDRRPADYIA